MKYYSEVLKKFFDKEEELVKAEDVYSTNQALEKKKADERKAARTEAAKDVESKMKAAAEARKIADKALSDFVKKYGNYHYTITDASNEDIDDYWNSLVSWIFR